MYAFTPRRVTEVFVILVQDDHRGQWRCSGRCVSRPKSPSPPMHFGGRRRIPTTPTGRGRCNRRIRRRHSSRSSRRAVPDQLPHQRLHLGPAVGADDPDPHAGDEQAHHQIDQAGPRCELAVGIDVGNRVVESRRSPRAEGRCRRRKSGPTRTSASQVRAPAWKTASDDPGSRHPPRGGWGGLLGVPLQPAA